MRANRITPRRILTATIAAVAGIGLTLPTWTSPAQAAGYSTPAGLKATAVSSTAISLSWKAVKNAPAYRVQFSTSSKMSSFKTMDLTTNSIDWLYLDPDQTAAPKRLKPATSYYFRVKVIGLADLSHSAASLTSYSRTLKVTTSKSTGWFTTAPTGLRSSAQTPTTEYLSWNTRGPGLAYRVSVATTSTFDKARTTTFPASGGLLTGLTAGTKYYYRVRVISTASPAVTLSGYSTAGSFTTTTAAKAPSLPFKVATYNICSFVSSCWNDADWSTRRDLLARNIAAQAPDILGTEESNRVGDLIDTLNTNYKGSYELAERTGHASLAFNTTRFTLVGEQNADDDDPATPQPTGQHYWAADSGKDAVWATLADKVTGKEIFVVALHLTNGGSAANSAARESEAKELVELVASNNADQLPVIVAGDFNASKRNPLANHRAIYSTMTAAGFIDSLGNPTDSRYPDAAALSSQRIDVSYNTANNLFDPQNNTGLAPFSKWLNGYDVDYIWHSAAVKVDQIRTVVSLDLNGKFTGTLADGTPIAYPPSDHNMLTAWVHLS